MHGLDLAETSPNVPEEVRDVTGASVGSTTEVPLRITGVVGGGLS